MAAGDTITNVPLFQDSKSLLDFLNGLFGTQSSSTSETNTTLDPDTSALVQNFLGTILPEINDPSNSPDAAEAKTHDVVDNLFRQYREGIPAIEGGMNTAGSYNSSTAQLLANDVFARTTGNAADTVLKARQQATSNKNSLRTMVMNTIMQIISRTGKTNTNTNNNNNAPKPAARTAALAAGALSGLTGKGKTPPKGNANAKTPDRGEVSKDDTSELERQIDAESPKQGPDPSEDIMNQILAGSDPNAVNIEPLPPVDGGDVNQINDTPDFDFSDAFSAFDFTGDGSGLGGEGGDTEGTDTRDSTSSGDEGPAGDTIDSDFPDFFSGGGDDTEVDG